MSSWLRARLSRDCARAIQRAERAEGLLAEALEALRQFVDPDDDWDDGELDDDLSWNPLYPIRLRRRAMAVLSRAKGEDE